MVKYAFKCEVTKLEEQVYFVCKNSLSLASRF